MTGTFWRFHNVAVTEQDKYSDNPSVFTFSFESRWRRMTLQRFVWLEGRKNEASVRFLKNMSMGLSHEWKNIMVACGLETRGHNRSAGTCPMRLMDFKTTLTRKSCNGPNDRTTTSPAL